MIKIVYGAPASGKSTYVKKHIKDNDIVFDYDRMMQAITLKNKYKRNDNVAYLLITLRSCIIRQHTMTKKKIDDIYIITTFISDKLKKELQYIDNNDIEYIKMKTSKNTCLKRIDNDESRKHLAEDMKKRVHQWYNTYKDVDFNKKNQTVLEQIINDLKKQTNILK